MEEFGWCIGKLAIFKHIQMLCSLLVTLFMIEGRSQWLPYTLIFLGVIVVGIASFMTLVAYFFQETAFNAGAVALSALFLAILAYDYLRMASGTWHHHRHLPAKNIGKEEWTNRILVILIVEIAATTAYAASLIRTMLIGIG